MGGITTVPRLERLLELRDRLDTEIAAEREAEQRRAEVVAARRAATEKAERVARRTAVSAATVRAWADRYGHPYPQRGRVPDSLIDQYLDANPDQAPTRRGRRLTTETSTP